VAAASDLAFAFEALAADFRKETGEELRFSFGSTGQLARQIAQGAPFDLFAAANVSFVEEVVAAGACDGGSQAHYARGRIVVWTPKGLAAPRTLAELADRRFVKVALANPEHAPYGRAAREALQAAGLWRALEGRLVYGENVQQTLKFAQSGNAEAALVALSLVSAGPVQEQGGTALLIDDALHRPIDQALVVCRHGKNPAGGRAFAAMIASRAGREVMRRHGFVLPGVAQASGP
jgi:molybdate transport system substrate-binding protein